MAEKNLNEISRELRALYTKAGEAARRDNFDYALTLFCQVLTSEPGCIDARKALRVAQAAKAGATTTSFFKKMVSGAGATSQYAKAKVLLGRNPVEAMAVAEEILNGDATNSSAHRIIVDAAQALEMPETAVLSLEILVRNSPKNKAAVLEFANTAATTGIGVKAAEKFLNDYVRSSAYDPDVVQAQKNLSASKTMDEGGYNALADGQGSYRDILKDKEQAKTLEQESRVQKSEDTAERLIAEYELRLPNEPLNYKLMRSLAELYTQKNRFVPALELYQRIKGSEMGGDATLDRAIAETTVRKFNFQASQVDSLAPDHAEQTARIQDEKSGYQLSEIQKRVEKYPTDLGLRFELGQQFFQQGKLGEAIAELQKAQQNPHKRIAAMGLLAQCFSQRGINDSAVRTLQNALKEKLVFDDEKKDLIYNLGCVFEKMGKRAEAMEQFLQIYETDISYRDVAAKVDAHYAAQG